jgi:hypothetical protein
MVHLFKVQVQTKKNKHILLYLFHIKVRWNGSIPFLKMLMHNIMIFMEWCNCLDVRR